MQHFDLSPLYRASIGFDQVSDLMNRVISTNSTTTSYPPYDIEKTADDLYRISIAVAGFSDADLNVEVKNKTLIISGKKDDSTTEKSFLHKGIATRAFERTFHLADYVKVKGASHSDGMLHIDVFREVPEELKPRQIEIAVQGSAKPIIEHYIRIAMWCAWFNFSSALPQLRVLLANRSHAGQALLSIIWKLSHQNTEH